MTWTLVGFVSVVLFVIIAICEAESKEVKRRRIVVGVGGHEHGPDFLNIGDCFRYVQPRLYGPVYPEPCTDMLANCDAFHNSTCTKYIKWAKVNCAKTCGVCRSTVLDACPEGWSLYKGDSTCIKGFGITQEQIIDCTVHHSWDKARTSCQGFGGDLVVIKDINKHVYITNKIRHIRNQEFWIGIRNVGQSDYDFQYVDGTKLGSYQPWLPNNPNKGQIVENCVLMHSVRAGSKELGKWDNYSCRICKGYFCQRPVNEIFA